MNRSELYNKTVGILVNAYFNDQLEHGNCFACAVGNIVAANCGINIVPDTNAAWFSRLAWEGFSDIRETPTFFCGSNEYRTATPSKDVLNMIEKTGYTLEELSKIEDYFENTNMADSTDEYMFNGLMAVVDALDIIHGNTDNNLTTSSKNRFAKI